VGNGRDITERKKAEETLLRSQQETTHANQLLLALSQAAQAVQRVRTQEEVYAAIQEQMTQLGYNTTVFELADEGKNLRIAFLSYASNLVHRAEKMTGLSMHDYRIRPRQGSIYQRVLKQGETVYVENGAEAVADALPRRLRPLAKPIAGLLYLQPSTFTPLLVGDERIGVFSVTGLDLRETDNIAITIFARQAAIAIQNARLYEQAQQEINERKLAEEALIYERNLLNALMDNIPDHIYFKDIDSRFIRMNRAQANGFGISNPVQAMGKTDFDFFTEQHARPAFENEQEIIKTGRPMVNFEETETYSDGRMATVSTTKIPFRNPDGQIIGTIGISRDITERKQAESKLKEYSEHLEEMVDERTRDLRQARDKLVRKEKLAVLGQLAGSVGHELRNPLGVISNSVYYLKMVQPDVNEKIKNHHAMIEEEVHNAAQIVSDLLDYAREISTDPKLGSVPELVEHTLSRFPVPASVQVSLKIPADLPQVYADPLHVEQVLGNLITNGCQAMISPALNQSTSSVTVSSGGKLTITARRQEQMVAIAVKDTGIGILPENKEKLFEPLFSTKINGIGLGLAVSKKLAEANGGRIELESEAGKGSTFTLYLPVIEGS
jgi:PAS domain S-box-containing protein